MKYCILILITLICLNSQAQNDSIEKKLTLQSDFRFRVEHDWNSKKSDGSLRDDRSRLRYRFRFGLNYKLNDWASFGGRLRTGNINDQQGPHITLGGGTGEFGLTQIGLDKLFFQIDLPHFKSWVGKNDLLLEKQNELFWNDNVIPDGIALNGNWKFSDNTLINSFDINAGHFIINAKNETFDKDSYFELIQLVSQHFNQNLKLFPGFYYFKDVGNIPDQQQQFNLSYSILHLGATAQIIDHSNVSLGFDYYSNVQDYSANDSIPIAFKNEKQGIVVSAKMGKLKQKGDWTVQLYYANLQKYAVVDYFAQNDWARWDYSSYGAFGSRLTNMKGIEFRVGYALAENLNLVLRSYFVKQVKTEGLERETGNRIRLDLNIKL